MFTKNLSSIRKIRNVIIRINFKLKQFNQRVYFGWANKCKMWRNKIRYLDKWIYFHLVKGTLTGLLLLNPCETVGVDQISFNQDVRSILSANCFSCHGPDKKARKAKLRLDTRDGALVDLGGYRAL